MPPSQTIYTFHVANLREVDRGLEQIARQLRRMLGEGDAASSSALTKAYALALAVKVECRLQKLLYEPNVTEADREAILAVDQQLDRWHAAVELGLRKHWAGPGKDLSQLSLGHDVHARYQTLRAAIEEDLRPVIELRNKLAHAQWVFPLSESNEVAVTQKRSLEREQALSLGLKNKILDSLADVVHDLVVSRRAFESSFERRFHELSLLRAELDERRFENYTAKLRAKRRRGREATTTAARRASERPSGSP
jgi:hypothetical protein